MNYGGLWLVCVLAFATPVFGADKEEPKNGVRVTVPFGESTPCTGSAAKGVPMTLKELGDDYYTESTQRFVPALNAVLNACDVANKEDEFVVVLFAAAPTASAEKPTIVRVILRRDGEVVSETSGFTGVEKATWVYLAGTQADVARIQLIVTPLENPLIAQLGPFAAAVAGGGAKLMMEGTSAATERKLDMFVSVARDVAIPFKRATISESAFVSTVYKSSGVELSQDTSFSNVPSSMITLHAGVGVLTGRLNGAKPAKVEDSKYVSDPLNRAATLAGVAVHFPFDSAAPEPSWQERLALVFGAVLTPAAGVYVGPSFGWRGFSLTAGRAWMWAHTTPDGFSIGEDATKKEGTKAGELAYGKVSAWMIGGTYVFDK